MIFSMSTHYSLCQIFSLFGSALLGIISIIFLHILKKYRIAFILLVLAAVVLRFTIIAFDPYPNIWDEQFHALVAKNLMSDPLKPMLYADPAFPVHPEMWISNHIWLHKPPLFLWLMALSMKIFGVNMVAARLPGAIMSLLTVLMIYSIARQQLNKYIAYYALLLATFSVFMLDLVSGYNSTDHNDTAFVFWVTTSFWCWCRYMQKQNIKRAILVGIAAGCAILVKWLPGLLIFAAWGLAILISSDLRKNKFNYVHFLLAFVACLLVSVPWFVYAALTFPHEFFIAFHAKAKHFSHVIEGHEGSLFYHFHVMDIIYAPGVKWLVVPAIILLFRRIRTIEMKTAFLSMVLVPFIFYSLAATKMPAFTLISASVVFIALGTFIYDLLLFYRPRYSKSKIIARYVVVLLLAGSMLWFYNIDSIQYKHTKWKKEIARYRTERTHSVKLFRFLAKQNYPENSVFLNCKQYDAVMMMFFTPFTAYDGIPDSNQMQHIAESRRPVYAFDNGQMQDFWQQYPFVKPLRHVRYWETALE